MRGHVPVLPNQTFEALSLAAGQTYVDCTAGLGGHALLASKLVGASGTVVLNDLDSGNLQRAADAIGGAIEAGDSGCDVEQIQGNFAEMPAEMAQRGLKADAVLADLGFASVHVDDARRGFSFMRDGPLDMRYDPAGGRPSAADLVNTLSESELVSLLREFGEEPRAKAVAQKLIQQREVSPIETTSALAEVIRSVVSRGRGRGQGMDPATRTFQALRIAVNDELGSLSALLAAIRYDGQAWLQKDARIGIISFHSLEDRLVKRAFADLVDRGRAEQVTGKPVTATEDEIADNPRSRSAKLRVIRMKQ